MDANDSLQQRLQVACAIRGYLEEEGLEFQEESGEDGIVDSFLMGVTLPGPDGYLRCRLRATHHLRTFYLLVATGQQVAPGERAEALFWKLLNSYIDNDYLTFGTFYLGSDREIYYLSSHYLHGPEQVWVEGIGHTFHATFYDIARFFRLAKECLGDEIGRVFLPKPMPRGAGRLHLVRR